MNGDKAFIDTNIFVYAKLNDDKEEEKRERAVRFLDNISQEIVISVQVVNEFSNVLLRNEVPDALIRSAVDVISTTCKVAPLTLETTKLAWQVRAERRFSYWDSLIVASALENGCAVLFSEDLQHGRTLEVSDSFVRIVSTRLCRSVEFYGNSGGVSDMSDVRMTGARQLAIRVFRGLA